MKKFAMAAVAAAALSAGVAQAYTVGTYSNGVVVPNVIHNGAADTTAVGLINQSGGTRAVYWTFFDQNSNHITDGCFPMTNRDYQSFIWANESGGSLTNVRGYLVFALGATTAGGAAQTACSGAAVLATGTDAVGISANAFQVNAVAKDVAFTPVIDGPLLIGSAVDITKMDANSLVAVAGAAQTFGAVAPTFSMRYAIDQAQLGLDTAVVVWSTGDHRGTHTVNIYDDKQNRKSVNFALKKAELDWFDPETILGLPATFTDGFIEWTPNVVPGDFAALGGTPGTALAQQTQGSVFTYSSISSTAFGAVQTLLGAHTVVAP
ncbi:hypothetical protein KW843_00740 [Acidovorax sp. sif1233]|uniref:hypothetical protein n=1 Tax=Acidovorax sp. sif1233 TaxID=2854792 RepID=UPI001C456862|nr:hypothetical protein [Acidovorax sp. sif1233]MBV7452988.1 hypothetical protein [Acidovorax sp. sif1233]